MQTLKFSAITKSIKNKDVIEKRTRKTACEESAVENASLSKTLPGGSRVSKNQRKEMRQMRESLVISGTEDSIDNIGSRMIEGKQPGKMGSTSKSMNRGWNASTKMLNATTKMHEKTGSPARRASFPKKERQAATTAKSRTSGSHLNLPLQKNANS